MEINLKIQQISNKFKELKQTDFPVVKKMAIAELRQLAAEAKQIMDIHECAENHKRRRQIDDILVKCNQIEGKIDVNLDKDIGNGGRRARNHQPSRSSEEFEMMAVRSVITHTIRSSQMKIAPEEFDEIARKMYKNKEVMEQIREMVAEQGEDLDKIEECLEKANENVVEANMELTEAAQIQNKTRMMKLRLAVTGFFGGLGYKILGLPGMLMGLLFGYRSTS